jgi:hypothetical protein
MVHCWDGQRHAIVEDRVDGGVAILTAHIGNECGEGVFIDIAVAQQVLLAPDFCGEIVGHGVTFWG